MAFPVRITRRPEFWSGSGVGESNEGDIAIRCFLDRKQTRPVDLTAFGDTWQSKVRKDGSAAVVTTFACVLTRLMLGELRLTLTSSQIAQLRKGYFTYDVIVSGGPTSPLTMFRGGFLVTDGS